MQVKRGIPNIKMYEVTSKINKLNDEESNANPHFKSKTDILEQKLNNKIVTKFTCSLCSKGCDTNENLIQHKEVHVKENQIFTCEICKVAFSDHYSHLTHVSQHSSGTSHKCVKCGLICNKDYLKHLKTHFDVKNKHIKSHRLTTVCVECGKMLKDNKSLKYHMGTHTGVKLFQCLYCGKGFASISQKLVHTRVHTNEKPYECKICHQRFKQASNLDRHKNPHKTEKNISCSVCDKKFYHEYSLQVHMRLHLNENLYPCEICGKLFQNVGGLRRHIMYKHADDRPLKCDTCNMSFKVVGDLRRHKRSRRHRNKWYGFTKEKHNG